MSVEDTSASTGVIRGWGCTPTGDQPRTVQENNAKSTCLPPALRRGWRRTALYAIIICLMALVFLNIALTLWIIGALKLSMNGIGPIKIVKHGIRLEGQAWVTDSLVASTITSQTAQPVTIHSHRNFTILVTDENQLELSKLFIKRDNFECSGKIFDVSDSRGNSVFHASRDEVRVHSDVLAVDGFGGLTVKSAVQAPLVRAPPGFDLQLESLTRRLDLRAPQSIYFESRAGSIDIVSHSDIKLQSAVGSIKIDASNIHLNNLKEASITDKPEKKSWSKKVYQLCACASGRLFLAAPDAICETDEKLCR